MGGWWEREEEEVGVEEGREEGGYDLRPFPYRQMILQWS